MAGRTTREIRDQDMQGLNRLREIRPLLSRLRKVGTERDRAGNRRLFMDQYCALILVALFSPAVESLRDLQRACALDKVRKRLGVTRASLGSMSGSVAIFDPAPLEEIAVGDRGVLPHVQAAARLPTPVLLRPQRPRVLERAMEAGEARMAKRSGHAESGGPDGRRERRARGYGQPRPADG